MPEFEQTKARTAKRTPNTGKHTKYVFSTIKQYIYENIVFSTTKQTSTANMTTVNYRGLPWTTVDYRGLPWNYRGTTVDYRGTTVDYRGTTVELPKSTKITNMQKQTQNVQKTSNNTQINQYVYEIIGNVENCGKQMN